MRLCNWLFGTSPKRGKPPSVEPPAAVEPLDVDTIVEAARRAGREEYLGGQAYDGRVKQGKAKRWRWFLYRGDEFVCSSAPGGHATWQEAADEFNALFPGVLFNVEHPANEAKP